MNVQNKKVNLDKAKRKRDRRGKLKEFRNVLSNVAKHVLPCAAGLAMSAVLGPASGPFCTFITTQLSKLNISINPDKIAEIADELVSTTTEESAKFLLTSKIVDEGTYNGIEITKILENQTEEINKINTKIEIAVQKSLQSTLEAIKESMSFIRNYPNETVEILAEVQHGKFKELSEKFSNFIDIHFEEISNQIKDTEIQLRNKIDSISSQLSNVFELLCSDSSKYLDRTSAITLCSVQFLSEVKSSQWDNPYNPDLYTKRDFAEKKMSCFFDDINKDVTSANFFTLLAGIGIGKTWLMAHMADELMKKGSPILFFTLKFGGISRISRILGANSQLDAYKIICNIAGATKMPLFIFLDGLDELPRAERRSIIQWAIDIRSYEGRYNVGFFISSRKNEWISNATINDLISKNLGMFYQTEENNGISLELSEFKNHEMIDTAKKYGIWEKLEKMPELRKFAKYPFILRLLGEYYKTNDYKLPNPDNIDEFMKIFYSKKNPNVNQTIMGRMGIRGSWLAIFGTILSCCNKDTLILDESKRIKTDVTRSDVNFMVSCGILIREFGFIECIKINPLYTKYVRELAKRHNIKLLDQNFQQSNSNENGVTNKAINYDYAKEKLIRLLNKNKFDDARRIMNIEIKKADSYQDIITWEKLNDLKIVLNDYINKYNSIIALENSKNNIRTYKEWYKLYEWCNKSELNGNSEILKRNSEKQKKNLKMSSLTYANQ